jgi:histone H3/H4
MTEGRGSDFNLDIPEGLDEQTVFQMSDPADGMQQTSPIVDQSVAEARGDEAHATQQNVVFGSDSDGGAGDFGMDGWDYNDGGMDDHSSINEEPDTALEPTVTTTTHHMPADDRLPRGLKANKKRKRISQHGIEYPSLPPAFVKRVAQTALQSSGLSNQRLSAETLDALIQSSEWFFEQLGDDLGAYADHAKRKTIEESDVFTLMKRYVISLGISSAFSWSHVLISYRQRQIGPRSSMFSLAQKHLPRELLQELRMPVPQPIKQRKAKRVSDQGDEREVAEYT